MINKDINIKVLSNSMIILDKTILGINGENLQGKIIFNFEKFIDGVAWLEIEKENGEKGYIQMTKENETYTLQIKSSLLNQAGYIYMQLRITQDENVNGIPVFKSKKFYVEVLNAINATATIEDDYPSIIDIVNTKQDKLTAGENITIKDNVISANIEGTVNKTYVDDQDTKTLESAKQYADNQVPATVETYVNEHKEELRGEKGDTGPQGIQGPQGPIGPQGVTGSAGKDGVDGKSAYQVWLDSGNVGSEEDFLNSLVGPQGPKGETGLQGEIGPQGIPGNNGADGKDGISATHSWNGTVLTITSASGTSSADLKGDKGDRGPQGIQGTKGDKGDIGPQGPKGETGPQGDKGDTGDKGDDGFSPIANVTQTQSGATITITDKNGTTTTEIKNGKDGANGKNYSVEIVESTSNTQEIQSNKFYKFGEVSSLNITLAAITDTSVLNEYMFEFTSGSTATTLTLPNTIKWLETPTIESNKIYQCSIVDNVGVLLGVSNV